MAKKKHVTKFKAKIPGDAAYIDEAKRKYTDELGDDWELDEDVSLSRSDDGTGAWVRSWVWVYADDARKGVETSSKKKRR